jgi:hypothetical protein
MSPFSGTGRLERLGDHDLRSTHLGDAAHVGSPLGAASSAWEITGKDSGPRDPAGYEFRKQYVVLQSIEKDKDRSTSVQP